ncbi:hypothetical protein QBC37DRAFT_104925 [Rhypophila decipiens]|uniref:Uncharacterized protein n=1 Tax=Rhypophila decipiens TaxID=261697 RepID=A0AAN6XUK9_9PEZI|nr:hypothetical protein QBC37DRAFT_104925 [Rhypophila decipiens]
MPYGIQDSFRIPSYGGCRERDLAFDRPTDPAHHHSSSLSFSRPPSGPSTHPHGACTECTARYVPVSSPRQKTGRWNALQPQKSPPFLFVCSALLLLPFPLTHTWPCSRQQTHSHTMQGGKNMGAWIPCTVQATSYLSNMSTQPLCASGMSMQTHSDDLVAGSRVVLTSTWSCKHPLAWVAVELPNLLLCSLQTVHLSGWLVIFFRHFSCICCSVSLSFFCSPSTAPLLPAATSGERR